LVYKASISFLEITLIFSFQSWYKKSNLRTVLSECQLNQGNTLESHPSINFFNKSNTLQLKYLSHFVYPKFYNNYL
jgi:hypothetical protein